MAEMDQAKQIIEGPITDSGQLLLALILNNLAGPDGWVYGYHQPIWSAARMTERTFRARLKEMKAKGYVEDQKKPFPRLRLTDSALQISQEVLQISQEDRQISQAPELPALQISQEDRQISQDDRQISQGDRQISQGENASAYLPKRYKDKEIEIRDRNPPPPPGELVLVAENPAPESPRLDQPAAQPPAVVEQSALLPATPKRKRAKSKTTLLAEDWEPDQDTLDQLEKQGIPAEYSLSTVWEFRRYWVAAGKRKIEWHTTFANNVKKLWGWKKQDEQNAEQRQRYTDASGRPISEREYVARQLTKRVVADLDSGVLDGVDLDTKF